MLVNIDKNTKALERRYYMRLFGKNLVFYGNVKQPLFSLRDVLRIVGYKDYKNPHKVINYISDNNLYYFKAEHKQGHSDMYLVNEKGIIELVLSLRGKKFEKLRAEVIDMLLVNQTQVIYDYM